MATDVPLVPYNGIIGYAYFHCPISSSPRLLLIRPRVPVFYYKGPTQLDRPDSIYSHELSLT